MQACTQASPGPWSGVAKPEGGFRSISTRQICLVWSAWRSGILAKFLDVRVYWALHEIAERREAGVRSSHQGLTPSRGRRFDLRLVSEEARKLTGVVRLSAICGSLRCLQLSGLVSITPDAILLEGPGADLAGALQSLASAMGQRIHDRESVHTRAVPIPRRTLRYLATCGRPAVAATMLAYILRCLWHRCGRLATTGSCSTAFVAGVFGIHERNVKRARRLLQQIGWLRPVDAPLWHVNRYGGRATIDPAWTPTRRRREPFTTRSRGIIKSPPPCASNDAGSPPPMEKRYLPSGSKNQYPAGLGPAGVRKRTGKGKSPTLRHIEVEDLHDTQRLRLLLGEAIARGLVEDCPADELRFFAAAEHAKRVGRRNPAGLFATIVRRGLWSFLADVDEERALSRLKQIDHDVPTAESTGADVLPNGSLVGRRPDGSPAPGRRITILVRELAEKRSLDGTLRAMKNAKRPTSAPSGHGSPVAPDQPRRAITSPPRGRIPINRGPEFCRHATGPRQRPAARVPVGPRSEDRATASGRRDDRV